MNIDIMILDNNPASRAKIVSALDHINDSPLSTAKNQHINLSLHEHDNFRDTVATISRFTMVIVIVNISSINLHDYKEDCIQLRSIYSFAPILAISDSTTWGSDATVI